MAIKDALATGLASVGQFLGAPEMNWSEQLAGSPNQTQPISNYTTGLLGSGGNIISPIPGSASAYPVSGGTYQSGPFQGQISQPDSNSARIGPVAGGGGGQVLGAGTGGGDSRLTELGKIGDQMNGPQRDEYDRLFNEQRNNVKNQAQIDLENALGEFDYQKEGLQAQSGQLDQQRLSALGTLDTSRGQAQTEATKAKEESASSTESAKNKALGAAQSVQRQNRNILRALGILQSSAGGEMLSKPMNEYQSQSGQLEQSHVKRLSTVEDWLMQRTQEFDKSKTDLETQYANLKENINRDLRFNDRQRLTAVKAASAALQQRTAEIDQQKLQYQQAAEQQSNNLLLKLAQLKMYQNPTADVTSIYNTLLQNAQSGMKAQTVGTVTEDPNKKLLSGLG
jgi:hypothetical protein